MSIPPKPVIVAPVSRQLAVSDAERSLAFYRDVLGFEVGEASAGAVELRYGPARLSLERRDDAMDSTGVLRPRGAAIIFFQTDDVAAMHSAIAAHGGAPSEPEKVNWIKMRMFQVRDPDGHTLWFGESFHEPYSAQRIPAGEGQLRRALPELPLDDVAAGVAYYRDVLGFRVNYQQHDLGVMDRDSITLVLIARTERHQGIGSAYVYIQDADRLHAELVAKGAKVQGTPVSQPWGLREFRVLDPEGNRITFGQTFE